MEARRSPLDSLKPLAGRALELALERVIALDPETQAELAKLDGRRIELALESPPIALSATVRDGRVRIGPPEREPEPDLGLRANLGGLFAQLPFGRGRNAPAARLRINGDAELARTLQGLARNFDPDWEQPFADTLGPVLGPQVARALREGLRGSAEVARKFARDAADYLTEESRDAVGRAELSAFLDDVDELRDRAERALARAQRLHGYGEAKAETIVPEGKHG
jgi:ubiquinone biosynthesis protein UbiJ